MHKCPVHLRTSLPLITDARMWPEIVQTLQSFIELRSVKWVAFLHDSTSKHLTLMYVPLLFACRIDVWKKCHLSVKKEKKITKMRISTLTPIYKLLELLLMLSWMDISLLNTHTRTHMDMHTYSPPLPFTWHFIHTNSPTCILIIFAS